MVNNHVVAMLAREREREEGLNDPWGLIIHLTTHMCVYVLLCIVRTQSKATKILSSMYPQTRILNQHMQVCQKTSLLQGQQSFL